MTRLDACLAFTAVLEGGWSNHPRDPGGPTMKGVTIAVFRAWRDKACTLAELRAITDAEVTALYAAEYFQPCRCQDLPPGLDLMVFDMAINSGVRRSGKLLQEVLRMNNVDGWIGVGTLAAVKHAPPGLIERLSLRQERYYRSLPGFVDFGNGWMDRLKRRTATALRASQDAATPAAPAVVLHRAVASVAADALNDAEMARIAALRG